MTTCADSCGPTGNCRWRFFPQRRANDQSYSNEGGPKWRPLRSLGSRQSASRLAGPTYIQNADAIYRRTLDREWLFKELPSVNLAADYLASLTTSEARSAGRATILSVPLASNATAWPSVMPQMRFGAAALNALAGKAEPARRYQELADRIVFNFRSHFWVKDHFAEYIHPQHGAIASHGLTDVDWSAIAAGMADSEQVAVLWPKLKDEKRFYYGGMPTGIATLPETYEGWEFANGPGDRYDLAAMGRVWYLESWRERRWGMARDWSSPFARSAKWANKADTTGKSDTPPTDRTA